MTFSVQKFAAVALMATASTFSFAHAETLKVSAWGGFFEETLAAEIYPGFTAETGIEVESIAQPADQAWLTQLTAAARANSAPADLSLVADEVLIRGMNIGLWADLDKTMMPAIGGLKDGYVKMNDDGAVNAVGALSWFNTFVTNTDYSAEAPTSWADFWDRDWDGKLGMLTNSNSGLMEATAVTFFGGYEIMETREGLQQIIDKIAELKPKVSLWYRDEGQFQQSLEAGELNAGMYYHDVTMLSVWDGLPVATTFPKEGGIVGDAYWVVPAASKHADAAQKFMDYMSRPEVQAQMSLTLGIFPVVPRDALDISDEDFAAVGSTITPIRAQTAIHLREGDWLRDRFLEMVAQ